MKKLLMIAALTLAVAPAMASKARTTALTNAASVTDIQDVFINPSFLNDHGDWATFEFGQAPTTSSGANSTPKAEAGFAKSMGDAKVGFYMGHHSAAFLEDRAGYLPPDNTINFFYAGKAGELAYGAGLEYSNTDKKSAKQKQSTTGLSAGVKASNWDAYALLGLTNKFTDDSTAGSEVDFSGKTAIDLGGTFTMDDMIFSIAYGMNGGEEKIGGTTTHERKSSDWSLGVERFTAKDGTHFFYGAKYTYSLSQDDHASGSADDKKTTTTMMPVYFGIEADATSWMVLRGSVTQNVLLGRTKSETGGTGEEDTISNNTTVAAGAGLKFGKLMIDGTLSAASSATAAVNGTALLANGSLTYKF